MTLWAVASFVKHCSNRRPNWLNSSPGLGSLVPLILLLIRTCGLRPMSPSNQVSNSHFQLGRRKGLFEKIYGVGGESFEVGSVLTSPICNRIARHEQNGQLW